MLLVHGDRERTLEDYTNLLAQAGFQLERTIPALCPPLPWTVIETIHR